MCLCAYVLLSKKDLMCLCASVLEKQDFCLRKQKGVSSRRRLLYILKVVMSLLYLLVGEDGFEPPKV